MAKQWVRDVLLTEPAAGGVMGNVAEMNLIIYNFLRVCGWTWLWECDGSMNAVDPSNIVDGNMESDYEWTGTNITTAKTTDEKHSGSQSLEITADIGGYLEFTGGENHVAPVTGILSFWAKNTSDQPWTIECNTTFAGGFVQVGEIDTIDAWTQYKINIDIEDVSAPFTFKIINAGGAADSVLYLDDVIWCESWFERNLVLEGDDCAVEAPNTVTISGMTDDHIGMHLFIYDSVNNKNSGCYEISSATTVDLRSGSAEFIESTGLIYRIVNVIGNAPDQKTGTDYSQKSCGFMIESPHESAWRFMLRQNMALGQVYKCTEIWAAPQATDFDSQTGMFYMLGPSCSRDKCDANFYLGTGENLGNIHAWKGAYTYNTSYSTRSFMMTDDDGSFFAFYHRDTLNGYDGYAVIGYLGENEHFPGIEEFAILSRFAKQNPYSEPYHSSDYNRYGVRGTTFYSDGFSRECNASVLGFWTDSELEMLANGKANPFDGEEWIYPLIVFRDSSGAYGVPADRSTDIGIYQTRKGLSTLVTFDDNKYLHLINSIVWEWMEESLVP